MYLSHWGLRHCPFPAVPSQRTFFRSPTHDEALARLHFLADEHRRLGLVLGGPGSGKTALLQVFAREVRQRVLGVFIAAVGALRGAEHQFAIFKMRKLPVVRERGDAEGRAPGGARGVAPDGWGRRGRR